MIDPDGLWTNSVTIILNMKSRMIMIMIFIKCYFNVIVSFVFPV